MFSFTLQQLFGSNASQTTSVITITKSDLPGLTFLANNTAESLLVALILNAWQEFEGIVVDELNNNLVDEVGNTVNYNQREFYEKLNVWFWKRQFIDGNIRDTFVVDVFVYPPSNYGENLDVDSL